MSISSLQLLIKCRCWWWYEAAGSQVGATWHSTVEISPWPPESWLRSPWWHVLVIVMVMVCTDHHTGNNNISCHISSLSTSSLIPQPPPEKLSRQRRVWWRQGRLVGLLWQCGHFPVVGYQETTRSLRVVGRPVSTVLVSHNTSTSTTAQSGQ